MPEPIVMENNGTVYTDFTVRWTMQVGQPRFGIWSTRDFAVKQLAEPIAGATSGEMVQRTTTTTPWRVVPDVPAVQGLFAQPAHDFTVFSGFPAELVKETSPHNSLRYMWIGEDAEQIVILGHPPRQELDALPSWLDFEPDGDPVETYARLLWACAKHKKRSSPKSSCRGCREQRAGAWWMDWWTGKKKSPKANGGKPGYFPIMVWDVLV
ncbi:hypothetical protein PV646_28530 [Streptomyces sp. ID05-26A]|nr:hypothetical protein [Streptomyces sp. ID05-26A]